MDLTNFEPLASVLAIIQQFRRAIKVHWMNKPGFKLFLKTYC